MRKYSYCIMIVLLSVLAMTGCAGESSKQNIVSADDSTDTTDEASIQSAITVPMNISYQQQDIEESYDEANAVQIFLSNSEIKITGNGAQAEDSVVTITQAGTYVLNGSLSDGQVIVDTDKNSEVHLVLNGVSIGCSNSAPVYIKKADRTKITLLTGSENILTDGEEYISIEGDDQPNATLYSKNDLVINGSGKLIINANYNNGITTKDHLIITNGTFDIKAVHDAIRGKDSLSIYGGEFILEAKGDGLKSNNSTNGEKGWISIDGGTFDITAGNDGIQAETVLQITAGTFKLTTGGGSANSSTKTSGKSGKVWGNWGNDQNQQAAEDTEESSASAKALKADADIYISGGEFEIDCSDDAVHSNQNVTIVDGSFNISSGDDGMHADDTLSIQGGTITITKSYEGLEGSVVKISGGVISLVASDDGINAAGGSDNSSINGRTGQNNFMEGNDDNYIEISGGEILVQASGDGLDSNGDIRITGGMTIVYGPTNNGDAAVDFDGDCEISGGVLAATGSSGMAQYPGSVSSQHTIAITYSTIQEAGTKLTVTDSNGTILYTDTPQKDYQNAVISIKELQKDETYTVESGSIKTEVVLSDITTRVDDSGEAVIGGFGGGIGGGPNGGRGDRSSDQKSEDRTRGGEPPERRDGEGKGQDIENKMEDDRQPPTDSEQPKMPENAE